MPLAAVDGSGSVDEIEVGAPFTALEALGDVEFRDGLSGVEERNLLATLAVGYPAEEVAKFVSSLIADVDDGRQQTHSSDAYGGSQRALRKDVQR
ncbi:hypothetical protein [Nocardia sp. NPDC057440]|uniref:hypothetical protein n=1 Tax=Nocardia sp. NPDC057440 TaxID=3346134 RepID=UPI0036700952